MPLPSLRSIATTLVLLLASPLLPASRFHAVPGGTPGGNGGGLRAQSPAAYEGAQATGLALRKLGNTARVLHIGAHPDDENTALFAPLALGRGADAAYLSLTRGEGGQNSIGPELGTALGLIRAEELLAARRLDGGDQFFTRAIDYGYSKDADEAFRHWPRDSLLADVVAVIRQYRPDVVISVWSGTPADGHGQHQASGLVARAAVLAAGDPTRFPEQIEAGLRPHTPAKFMWSGRYSESGPDVELPTGELDPLLGRSYYQIAMASRSLHRSQDMGQAQRPGPRSTGFDIIDPANPPAAAGRGSWGGSTGVARATASMFAGIDTLLSQRAARVARSAAGDGRLLLERAVDAFRRYEATVAEARRELNPLTPSEVAPLLGSAYATLASVAGSLGGGAAPDLTYHYLQELEDARDAWLRAANVVVDVVAGEATVVPGQSFELELSVWNGGDSPVRASVGPLLPPGWTAAPTGEPMGSVAPGERGVATFRVAVPNDAEPTMPYYLDPSRPAPRDMYHWPESYDLRGQPFAPDPVRGSFLLYLGDSTLPLDFERSARWLGVDARSGEYSRPVKVVPAVAVDLTPGISVLPVARARRPLPFTVRLRSGHADSLPGTLRLAVPTGWTAEPAAAPVALGPGEERSVSFAVRAPDGVAPGAHAVEAVFETRPSAPDGGRAYRLGYDIVDYPHIAPHNLYEQADATVRAFDVAVADVEVGFVEGSGGGVAEALEQMGLDVARLSPTDLATGDLDRFDVIVTGILAYEVRPDLQAHNARLLDWVRAGGTLLVQYNRYPFPRGDFAPWPVTISRPHGRVTDETAPVTVLEPDHPVFTTPNRIGPADWEGWVQERGLYFWDTWDGPLTPLLAMADPGEEPLTGSLLVAPLGQGTYVYTGLAFFRQLPAGVPGAYRLLANLVSLGAR